MRVDVTTEIEIERPVAEVADFSGDPQKAPQWYVNIKSVEWARSENWVLGSQVAFVAHFLGRRIAYTYELVEFVPHQRMVMRTAQGPFPMETSYTWRAIDAQRTWMQLRNQDDAQGFSAIMSPFMSMAMRRANQKDLRRLKAQMELQSS